MPQAVCLIDHDNVPISRLSVTDLLTQWLASLPPEDEDLPVQDLLVRAYGGWWYESNVSNSRYQAAATYAAHCPAMLRVRGRYWRILFEFADTLLAPSATPLGPRIDNTFVLRPAPQLFLPRQPELACLEQDCEALRLRKWVRQRRGCTRKACPKSFGDLWFKPEQKQVDIHLALDLLTLNGPMSAVRHLSVASDDIDFAPALWLASAALPEYRTLTSIRFSTSPPYFDAHLQDTKVTILRYQFN